MFVRACSSSCKQFNSAYMKRDARYPSPRFASSSKIKLLVTGKKQVSNQHFYTNTCIKHLTFSLC